VTTLTVITVFQERKREKRIQYEKKMLRELSIQKLQTEVKNYFSPFLPPTHIYYAVIEDGCIDFAIETYLLGASFSRFGYYGEPVSTVRKRCKREEKSCTDLLYEFIRTWIDLNDDMMEGSLFLSCEQYIQYWWDLGYQEGLKKFRLKMH
jgi:hypothetical protein